MALSFRLRLRRWRLRNQRVPRAGERPLTVLEWDRLNMAATGLRDQAATRRAVVDQERSEGLAKAAYGRRGR